MSQATPGAPASGSAPGRTLSFRAVAVGVAGMVLMGLWIHFHEVLVASPNILAENSPPASAVGILLAILVVGWLVTRLRRSLRLQRGELLVVYAMLVISAPLMSQGMWHRFLGLVAAIPHNQENMPLVDSFSGKLWPHGAQLVANGRFEDGMAGWTVAGGGAGTAASRPAGQATVVDVPVSQVKGTTRGLRITHAGGDENAETTVRTRVPRFRDGKELLVPGEKYYASVLIKAEAMRPRSSIRFDLAGDRGEAVAIACIQGADTGTTYSKPGGFVRTGYQYARIPRDVEQYVDLTFTLHGPGSATITDVHFFSNEALARLYKGSSEIPERDAAKLGKDRDSLLVRPDNLHSPAGIWYVLKGYIPYEQWATPALYWGSIVMAMFLGLLGLGVIFRKSWVENERFPFPMVVVPRLLLEERAEGGLVIRPLLRSRAMHAGIAVALVYCVLLGLAHYVPGMPSPAVNVNLEDYVSSPAAKSFIHGMGGAPFSIVLLFVSIAFFVELDMLLSILLLFWVCKIPFYFGETFGWKNLQGPVGGFPFPHEQHIGAFLSLAGVAVWTARRHLAGVGRRILGLPGGADDSGEAMRYRTAALLVVGAFVFFGFWGGASGLGAGSALVFFGFLMVCGLSASRIRTECGAPFTYFTPYFPYLIFVLLGGLMNFSLQTMVLAFAAGGFMAVAQFLLMAPSQVEMLYLGDTLGARPRGVSRALVLGALGGLLVGGYLMLVWCYGGGGENIPYMRNWALQQNWYFTPLRNMVATMDASSAKALASGTPMTGEYPAGPLAGVGVGAGVTLVLTALRTAFVGFWLHPIGYVLANTHFITGAWGSLLVAWAVKWVSLKIGGPRLVREKMTPFFGGLFVGSVLGMILWDVVALVAMSRNVRDVFTCMP